MKSRFLALIILAFPIASQAQSTMRPVLDSAVTCSYQKRTYEFSENASMGKQILEVFYIVENMPRSITSKNDMDDILNNSIRLNEQEKSFTGDIYLQCVVNCKGKTGDFQINHCPAESINIACQILNIFSDKFNKWKPGNQRGNEVDVLIMIKVSVSKGQFSVVAPI